MIGVAHVIHVAYVGMILQELGDCERVFLLALQAHVERLQAAQHQPAVKRVQKRAL